MRPWLVLAALVPLACGPSDSSAPSSRWPAGTALVVGDQIPIRADEVDPYLPAVALIEPRYVEKQLVRLALTNIVLPRAVGRVLAGPAACERAERAAREARVAIDDGSWTGPAAPGSSGGSSIAGSFSEIGLVRWAHAFELQPGEWSPVFEEVGAFSIIRCVRRNDGRLPIQTEFELEVISFFYLPEDKGLVMVEEGYDRVKLDILDPEWRTIVPELLQYRMGVHSP
ncbi:MAG: hypothetical protein IT453_02365 [Planctomycetes bacterium]|nr:hypothetical protein [Planctomycetota bacterium]